MTPFRSMTFLCLFFLLISHDTIQDLQKGVWVRPMRRTLLVLGKVNILCFMGSLLVVSSLCSNLGFKSLKHPLCPLKFFIRNRSRLKVVHFSFETRSNQPNHSWIPITLPQISKGLVTRLLYHPDNANLK